LGYPTFHDIKKKFKARRTGETVRFSLFTKLNFIVYFTLFILGPLSVFGTEIADSSKSLIFNNYSLDANGNAVNLTPKPAGVIAMDIIFNASSTRNAGFSSININDFNGGSKAIMGVLMFIGSAPSSTAGGIRTTTLAILILSTISIIRNRQNVIAFKRKIPSEIVVRAFAVLFLSALILAIGIIISFADSSNAIASGHAGDSAIIESFLLFTSAFGTVGLNPFSAEQTYALGALTKITLIFIMFLGQLGISNALLIFVKSGVKRHYDYLEESVVIG
jgi:Trk-type K+ transport system membrane component